VTVGDWVGDAWHVVEGLQAGERVVVDGGLKLASGAALHVRDASAAPAAPKPAAAAK